MKKHLIACLLSLLAMTAYAADNNDDYFTDKLTIALDAKPNPDHAPLIVAQQQGFFKENGLIVNFITPNQSNDSSKLVARDKADVGVTYQPDLMRQIDAGQSVVQIGTLIDRPLDCIVTLKKSGITKLADLRGKRIGVKKSDINSIMLKAMLKSAGLSEKDVKIVPFKQDAAQALASGKVDAVAGMTRNEDVPKLERKGLQVNAFFPEENGIPNYSVLVFITKKDNTGDSRLPRFLAAMKLAVDFLDEHPEQGWKGYIKLYPQANNKVNHDMWLATLPYFAEDPAAFDQNEWKHFAEFMRHNDMIKMAQPVSKYAVTIG